MTSNLAYTYNKKDFDSTTLFLHGWGCNQNYMLPISNLKNSSSLIIDLPGFGKSKPLSTPYELDDYVEDILLFLLENNITVTHIVAHSFGSKIAIKLAKTLKIKGLILIGPSIYHKVRGPRYYIKVLLYKIIKHFKCLDKFSKSMGSKDYKSLDPIMKKTMSNIINESLENQIKTLTIPTLLIFGNKDKITPIYLGKKIKRKIKDCELIILNGNHFAYLYNQKQTINIIESLVDSTCI